MISGEGERMGESCQGRGCSTVVIGGIHDGGSRWCGKVEVVQLQVDVMRGHGKKRV